MTDSDLAAGAARVTITPPLGVELAGYGFGPSTGVLDELEAAALYLEASGEVVVLVSADLLAVSAELVAALRRRATTELGLAPGRVLVAASHSHSTPTARSLRQWGVVDPAYLAFLETALFEVIRQARAAAVPARLGYGAGQVHGVSANRRGEGGAIDPQVPVLTLYRREPSAAEWNADEEPPNALPVGGVIAVVYNFACHPVALHSYRNLLSADYVATARSALTALLGEQTVTLFAMGAAGDVNPTPFYFRRTTPRQARRVGAIVGAEAAQAALDPPFAEDTPLRVITDLIPLPLAPLPSRAELEAHHARYAQESAAAHAVGRPLVETSVLDIQRDWAADALAAEQAPATAECEVTAVRVGPLALLYAPLEVFVETGLALKAASPAALTFLQTNANGELGYLPTAEAYRVEDYTNPQGLAPRVYGIFALAEGAEPLFRARCAALLTELFAA